MDSAPPPGLTDFKNKGLFRVKIVIRLAINKSWRGDWSVRCRVVSCRVVACRAVLCCAVLCHVVLCSDVL